MRDLFFERRMALVIGNADYAEAVGRLFNPINDASRLAEMLEKCGFDVQLMLDAGREELAAAQKDFVTAAEGADVSVFYYSGHGFQVSGENYLIPIDFDPGAPGSAADKSVNLTSFLREASQTSGTCIAFLDACRNNPQVVRSLNLPEQARQRRVEVGGGDEAICNTQTVGLAKFDLPPGDKNTFVAFATAPGSVAEDGSADHSPFASALMSQLGIPGLDLPDLMGRVTALVRAATKGKQVPWATSTLERAFLFKSFDVRPLLHFAAIALILLPPLAGILLLSVSHFTTELFFPIVLGISIGLTAMMGLHGFGVRQGYAITFALVVSASILAGVASDMLLNRPSPETMMVQAQQEIDAELTKAIAECANCSQPELDQINADAKAKKESRDKDILSYEIAAKSILSVTSNHPFLVFLPVSVMFFLSFQIAAVQRVWLQFLALVAGFLLATAEPKIIAPASTWTMRTLERAHLAMADAASPDPSQQEVQSAAAPEPETPSAPPEDAVTAQADAVEPDSQSSGGSVLTPGKTSGLGLLLASFLPLLGLGLGLATHTAERAVVRTVRRTRPVSARQAVLPLLLAGLAGLVAALFYPSDSYLGDTIPSFFGIQLMPSLLYGAVLFFTMYSRLGTTAYVAGLGYLSCVLVWVLCLPIAEGNWFLVPAISGAAPFSLLLAMMMSLQFRRFADPGFWVASALIGIAAGATWDYEFAKFILRTKNTELADFFTSALLFVSWMVAWTYVLLRYGLNPVAVAEPPAAGRTKARAL